MSMHFLWWLFGRKKRAPHQIGVVKDHPIPGNICYICACCQQTFYDACALQRRGEYCPGKRVYTPANLRPVPMNEEPLPDHLMRLEEIKATRRVLKKGQEPAAYLCYTLMPGPVEYIPLYDVRETRELSGALPLLLEAE